MPDRDYTPEDEQVLDLWHFLKVTFENLSWCKMSLDWLANDGNCPFLRWDDNLAIAECTHCEYGIERRCPEGEEEEWERDMGEGWYGQEDFVS